MLFTTTTITTTTMLFTSYNNNYVIYNYNYVIYNNNYVILIIAHKCSYLQCLPQSVHQGRMLIDLKVRHLESGS